MGDTFYAVPPDRHDRVVTQVQRDPQGLVVVAELADDPVAGARRRRPVFNRDRLRHVHAAVPERRTRRRSTARQREHDPADDLEPDRRAQGRSAAGRGRTRTRPFPIGSGKDKFGFGFQIETAPIEPGMRSAGSYSWGGIYNTHFWIDPERQVAAAVLMQVLPFYDEACMNVLRGFEKHLYQELR